MSARRAARFRALQGGTSRRLAKALRGFFAAQADRVVSRFLAGKSYATKDAAELIPDSEIRKLRIVLEPYLRALYEEAGGMAGDMVGVEGLSDEQLRRLLAQAAQRVTRITSETRSAIQQVLSTGRAAGYSDFQLARGVPADGFRGLRDVVAETYRGRADTIARTEVAVASQDAAHEVMADAGVTEVDIYDGEGCGWDGHDDPDEADGTRRDLEEAADMPISHPNCVRVSIPVVETRNR